MATVLSMSRSSGPRLSFGVEMEGRQFLTGLWRGLAGGLGAALAVFALLTGWATMKAEDTRARLAAAVPQITVPLDWDALAGRPPGSAPPTATKESHPPSAPVSSPPPPMEEKSASLALPPAPMDGLFETAATGRLPLVRATDGLTPFAAYQRPFDLAVAAPSGARGIVSLVVRDLGLSDSATATAIKTLPPDVTFTLTPYSAQPDFWQEQSRAAGHEIWMVLPTATAERNAGPLALSSAAGLDENGRNLLQTLSRTVGYAGVVLFDSSGPLASNSQGEKLRAPIFTRGLGLADLSGSVPVSETLGLAAIKAKIPYAGGAEILDRDLRSQSIRDALDLLEARAVARGRAVGVLSPTPVGYHEILTWIETLRRKNIVLAPLSAQMASALDKGAAP
jgi:polysaccharide deacetylase 2 family uncharacterized protein YibQ